MAVVIFHAGIERLAGGYLGVDVFYVISGFLITSIIMHEIEAGEFSLMGFYRRRIVRILPALFAMLAAVLAVACLVAMPPDIAAIGKSSAAAAGFIANMHFWQTTGYFDTAAEAAPLLHTWSLGVEEQFYILFPLLLIVLARKRLKTIWGLCLLCAASFALALWFGSWENGSDFYLLPARAWQLGLGALVATGFFPKAAKPVSGIVAGVGLVMLCVSFFLDMQFSAWAAVLPSFGAAFMIAYSEGSLVHRLLALPILRWLGAISYSLYLWHWPIITYYRMFYGLDLQPIEEAGLIAGSIGVAALSYYLVEQPFLRRLRSADARKTVAVGGLALIGMVCASLLVATRSEAWRSIPAEAIKVADYVTYADSPAFMAQSRKGPCQVYTLAQPYKPDLCAPLLPGKINVALIGDSHAAHYWRSLVDRFPHANIMQATGAGCAMLLDSVGLKHCAAVHRFAYGAMLARGHISHVILAERWTPGQIPQLRKTVAYFHSRGIGVTIIGPVAEYDARFPIALGRAMETGNASDVDRFRRNEIARTDALVRAAALASGAAYYSVYQAECARNTCAYTNPHDGAPLHFDYGHVTKSGADYLLRGLRLPVG